MFWNQLIALVDSTYSVLLISAFLELGIIDNSRELTISETFEFEFGVALAVIVLSYPILIFLVY